MPEQRFVFLILKTLSWGTYSVRGTACVLIEQTAGVHDITADHYYLDPPKQNNFNNPGNVTCLLSLLVIEQNANLATYIVKLCPFFRTRFLRIYLINLEIQCKLHMKYSDFAFKKPHVVLAKCIID